MTWLNSIDRQTLDRIITDGECMHLAADLDGGIMWASEAFCEWSGWTLNELQKLGWVRISVDDENLEADRQACEEMKAGSRTTYQVEKQYYKKDGTKNWGMLHVRKIDKSDGKFWFCWCAWTPMKNGNATAFAKAMEIHKLQQSASMALEKKFDEMITEFRTVTSRSDEENWAISSIRMSMRHPKIAIAFLVVAASLLGLDSVLSILRGIGFLPTPVHVEKADFDLLVPSEAKGISYARQEAETQRLRENVRVVTAGDRRYEVTRIAIRTVSGGVGELDGRSRETCRVSGIRGASESGVLGLRGQSESAGTVKDF